MHFLDGEVEARRHGYASFEEFITSDVMHGYLSIDYLERRPVFFRALPNEWDRELYDIIVASRKHKERYEGLVSNLYSFSSVYRIREQAARRQSTDVVSTSFCGMIYPHSFRTPLCTASHRPRRACTSLTVPMRRSSGVTTDSAQRTSSHQLTCFPTALLHNCNNQPQCTLGHRSRNLPSVIPSARRPR